MTEFWIFGAQLLAVALLFVMWPLWRGMAKSNQVARDSANLEIFRDQVAEMDADLANGLLTPELYEQGKRELESRLLDEVKPDGKAGVQPRNPLKALAVVLAIVIPLATVGLYWKLGNQNALLPQEQQISAQSFGMANTEAGLKELQDKLEKDPQNPNILVTLARSLAEMGRYSEAAQAYEKLVQMVPNEPEVWAEYADTAVMANNQSYLGKPTELLEHALALDPHNKKALALSGVAAMERGDYPAAVNYFESLQKLLPPDSQDAKTIQTLIDQAHTFLAQSHGGKKQKSMAQAPAQGMSAVPGKESISGTVTLGDALKARAAPDDIVFIMARAADGPPMPLAVIRKQVRDLPVQFTLDDSMAMAPQMKLSGFDRVVVVARVSKSGDAKAQPGDLQGASAVVKPGSTALKIRIDSVVK